MSGFLFIILCVFGIFVTLTVQIPAKRSLAIGSAYFSAVR